MNLNGSSTPVRPELDFTRLPLLPAMEMLQRVGAYLLNHLLSASEVPDLMDVLTRRDRKLLPFPSARLSGTQYLANFTQRLSRPNRLAWRLIGRERSPKAIISRLGRGEDYDLPTEWWDLVGARAWLDPNFQLQTGQTARQYLRSTTCFQLGLQPRPQFAPQTFWLLVLLEMSVHRQLISRPYSFRRRLARQIGEFEAIARSKVGETEWAGLWDQWIVLEAMRSWPDAIRSLDSPLRRALRELPLLKELDDDGVADSSTTARGNQEPINLARTDWKDEMPGWLPVSPVLSLRDAV